MKIQEIRDLLQQNPQYYSQNNQNSINNVKSGRQYYFIGDCGHEFLALPTNVFHNNHIRCPICSGHRVLIGFNDLWTTHPEIAALLKNKDDGYKYSAGSNIKLWWICPFCGTEKLASPNKVVVQKHFCTVCSHDTSYPEKFVSNLLHQFGIMFQKEKTFEWSDNKRYDFYLPIHHCIIETHGKQHYTNSDFSYVGNKTYIDEQYNDSDKMFYAKEYGKISHYITLDCRQSEIGWIKHSIRESGLLEILQIIPDTVDWEECHEFAVDNLTKSICDMYMNEKNIDTLCQIFHLSHNSIITKLKHGSQIGWCTYNPKEAVMQARKENGLRVIQTRSKPVLQVDMDNNIIQEFSSIQEAQRKSSISHIWDCIVGRRNSAGGYKWRYKNEYQ